MAATQREQQDTESSDSAAQRGGSRQRRTATVASGSGATPDTTPLAPTRTTILAAVCLAILAALFAYYFPGLSGYARQDTFSAILEAASFIICMAYSTELTSIAVASRHTAIPLLTIMLIIPGEFNHVFSLLILVTLICSAISANSLAIGSIRACTALAPIPLILQILGSQPQHLHRIFHLSIPRADTLQYLLAEWLGPLVAVTMAVLLVRLICDLALFLFCGVPVRASLREYSITRIAVLAVTDFIAIVVTIWLPAVMEFSNTRTSDNAILLLFAVSLDVYALILMSFYAIRRIMRSENSLRCLAAIGDCLPLPNDRQQDVIADVITRSLPNIRCFIMPAGQVETRPWHSYRQSQHIDNQGRQYVIVFERSMLNRPFLPADAEVLASAASILNEELRVHHEVNTLRSESETDPLTGAYTYQSFIAYLRSLQTESADNRVAVIYLDIDQLRRINERYGRLIGNTVLRATADRIRSIIPENTSVSRISGNEFAVVVNGYESQESVENLADRLRSATSLPIQTDGGAISVASTISMSFASAGERLTPLLSDAGLQDYAGIDSQDGTDTIKQAGKNPLTVSDILKSAIKSNHVSLLYQPLFSLRHRTMSALTMIPLIADDTGRRLDPDFIVSEARRLNLGCELTLDMLAIGMHDLLEFRKITPQLHAITLTLNGSELGDSRFYEHLEMLNARHPDITICLEFGETALNTAKDEFDNELEELTSMSNVDIAIARAGTTYSEISAIANIPLNTIKFDPTMISDYRNPRVVKLVKRAIQIAEDDGIHLVFDGVNTPEQTALLNDIGAHNAQGNMYASAMTASEIRMRLETMGLALGTPEPMPVGTPARHTSANATGVEALSKPEFDR